MAPKKDAFADLFSHASGSQKNDAPLNSRPAPWSDLDLLANGANGASSVDDDLVAFFGTTADDSKGAADSSKVNSEVDSKVNSKAADSKAAANSMGADSLWGDEFTDAYPEEGAGVLEESSWGREKRAQPPDSTWHPETSQRLQTRPHTDSDAVLAALLSEGFSVEMSNTAISRVGADFDACVQHIVRGALGEKPSQKDLGGAFQDMSSELYKKASWLFDKSKKSVIKNISNIQQQINHDPKDNSMPAWIKNQAQYKDQAIERRSDGTAYEGYGDDADNIDQEEIQRIIKAQREREALRRQERQDALKKETERNYFPSNSPVPNVRAPKERTVESSRTPEQKRASGTPKLEVDSEKPQVKEPPKPKSEPLDSFDLLGLGDGFSRAQKFKQSDDEIPVSRRRRPAKASAKVFSRLATAEALNAFQQSDYDTFKAKGSEFFNNGDYGSALESYTKCLESLPATHELRIVITLNLSLTAIKLGNYKLAKDSCDDGIRLIGDSIEDALWIINEKPIKYWYLRLLNRKAESYEMLENFPQALELYLLLVRYGVNDKKVMDAKRRVNNVVNPPKKAAPKARANIVSSNKNLQRVKAQHSQEKINDEKKFQLHDIVHDRVKLWSSGKEDNLRNLLMSLSDVLPQRLGFPFITTKKITINDLMLTKKVKINYMKVISSIHPDKLGQYELEDQMICQATFVTLNKAWDVFKEQNNIS